MFLTESMWLEPPGLNNLLEQDKSSAWKSDWHRRGVTGARMKYEPLVRCGVISSCSNYPQSAVSINPVYLVIFPVSLFYVSHTFFLVLWNCSYCIHILIQEVTFISLASSRPLSMLVFGGPLPSGRAGLCSCESKYVCVGRWTVWPKSYITPWVIFEPPYIKCLEIINKDGRNFTIYYVHMFTIQYIYYYYYYYIIYQYIILLKFCCYSPSCRFKPIRFFSMQPKLWCFKKLIKALQM